MIKDILVTLPTGDAPSIALDYAVTVARISMRTSLALHLCKTWPRWSIV